MCFFNTNMCNVIRGGGDESGQNTYAEKDMHLQYAYQEENEKG